MMCVVESTPRARERGTERPREREVHRQRGRARPREREVHRQRGRARQRGERGTQTARESETEGRERYTDREGGMWSRGISAVRVDQHVYSGGRKR